VTRTLVIAALLAQGLDLAAWSLAPHLEAGALGGLPPITVAIAKVAGIIIALLVVAALSRRAWQQAMLAFIIAAGAFGAGTAVAVVASL